MAAAAWVHGRDQLEPRRIGDVRLGARDGDPAGLQRLAQRLEDRAAEFRQLVEEQHAQMRERDLAGPRLAAAADHRRGRGRVVRAAERPPARQPAAVQPAADAGDHADLEHLGRIERGQHADQPGRQHRLAGARRPHQHQVVGAGRRDLERALGRLLALDVAQVRIAQLRLRPSAARAGAGAARLGRG